MLDQKLNSEIPLVFAPVVLIKTLGAGKAGEIRLRIDQRLDLCERGIHAGLVGDVLAEDRSREGRVDRCVEEEKDHLARSFHITVLSRNMQQAFRRATDKEGGGGVSSPGGRLHKNQATGCRCPLG